MIDDDTYFNESADSLALFTLFDALPDYCLTQKFWGQMAEMCPAGILSQLKTRRVNNG